MLTLLRSRVGARVPACAHARLLATRPNYLRPVGIPDVTSFASSPVSNTSSVLGARGGKATSKRRARGAISGHARTDEAEAEEAAYTPRNKSSDTRRPPHTLMSPGEHSDVVEPHPEREEDLEQLRAHMQSLCANGRRVVLVCDTRALARCIAHIVLVEPTLEHEAWECAELRDALPRITWLDEHAPAARLRRDSARQSRARVLPQVGEVHFYLSAATPTQGARLGGPHVEALRAHLQRAHEVILCTVPHSIAPFALILLLKQRIPPTMRHLTLTALTAQAFQHALAHATPLSPATVTPLRARAEAEYLWQRNLSAAFASRAALAGLAAPYTLLALARPVVLRAYARAVTPDTLEGSEAARCWELSVTVRMNERLTLQLQPDSAPPVLAPDVTTLRVPATVESVDETTRQDAPPQLWDAASLIGALETEYGFNVGEARRALDTLFHARLITAPTSMRTTLPRAWKQDYSAALHELASKLRVPAANSLSLPDAVWSAEHSEPAIVPLLPLNEAARRMLSLSTRVALAFRLIVTRTLQAAAPPCVVTACAVKVRAQERLFATTLESIAKPGWRAVQPWPDTLAPGSSAMPLKRSASATPHALSVGTVLEGELTVTAVPRPTLLTVQEWLAWVTHAVPHATHMQALRWLDALRAHRLLTLRHGILTPHARVMRVVKNHLQKTIAQPNFLDVLEQRFAQCKDVAHLLRATRELHADLRLVLELVPRTPFVPFDRYALATPEERRARFPHLPNLACPQCARATLVDFVFNFACVHSECSFIVAKDLADREEGLTVAQFTELVTMGRVALPKFQRMLELEHHGESVRVHVRVVEGSG